MALNAVDTAYNHGVDDAIKEVQRMSACLTISSNKAGSKMFSEFVQYLALLKKAG